MSTVFESLMTRLAAAGNYNANDQVAPTTLLWPDNDTQWLPLAEKRTEDRVND